ncbi:MAG TPA: VOC family protein [Bryobacteraceae bacterium]|nr:VOC family protein [Bryobacteraceae bacterium]
MSVRTSITPWLSVRDGKSALAFYKAAFGAKEEYLLDGGDKGIVARLCIDGAEYWVADESPGHGNPGPESAGGSPVRMILTVGDPDFVFAQAIRAGATEIHPVSEDHGWRIGRLKDPFGHQWEIGCELKQNRKD